MPRIKNAHSAKTQQIINKYRPSKEQQLREKYNVTKYSWLNTVEDNDKGIYFNKATGQVRTGSSVKGVLVKIAESLGIFKETCAAYRNTEATENRNAYDTAWARVKQSYGVEVADATQRELEGQGYCAAFPLLSRVSGHNPDDPFRIVTGREIRAIIDTARGVNRRVQSEKAAAPVSTPPEALWDSTTVTPEPKPEPEVAPQQEPATEVAEVKTTVPKELARAQVEENRAKALEQVQDTAKLMGLADKLGFDREAVSERLSYIQDKLQQRIEQDPRAQQGALTNKQLEELAGGVFEKALAKSVGIAKLKGAFRNAERNIAANFEPDLPTGKVDIMQLSREKVESAAHDIKRLKRLAAELPGSPVDRIKPARLNYIAETAKNHAEQLVAETKVVMDEAQVDQALSEAIAKSLEHGMAANKLKGAVKNVRRAVRTENTAMILDVQDAREQVQQNQEAAAQTQAQQQIQPQTQEVTPEPQVQTQVRQDRNPAPYKGVNFFSSRDPRVAKLPAAVKNHERAKQVVSDDAFLANAMQGITETSQLTPTHREYMKTTLLRRVDEFQRRHRNEEISVQEFGRMLNSVAARTFEIGSAGKLQAKMVGKKMVKHLGKSPFERELHDLQKKARTDASAMMKSPDLLTRTAKELGISIEINKSVLDELRPSVKKQAEEFVGTHHHLPADSDWRDMAEKAINQFYKIVPMENGEVTDG